jgi:uncharacterized repeat protein (TIGR01451 family)
MRKPSMFLLALAVLGLVSFAAVNSGAGSGPPGPAMPYVAEYCDDLTPCPAPPPRQVEPPVLGLNVQAPACAEAGQDVTYRLLLENRSASEAHHVIVHAPAPANARYVKASPEPHVTEPYPQWRLGTFPACGKQEITLTLRAAEAGTLDACFRVTSEHGVCVTTEVVGAAKREKPGVGPEPGDAGKPPVRPAALSFRKRAPAEAALGSTVTFELTVTNTGDAPAEGVQIIDTLPAGLEEAQGRKELIFTLGTLAPGATRTASYQAVVRAAGKICNKAVVTAAGGQRQEAEACVTVAAGKLRLSKTAPARQNFGPSLVYKLTVANDGPVPVSNVELFDPLPAETIFVSADGGRQVGSQVQWSLGTIAPGASRTVELKVRPQKPGVVVNKAEATAAGGLRAPAEARTEVVGASGLLLEVVDTADPIAVGEDTQYDILVRTQGSVPATNVRIEATAPAELVVIRAQGSADFKTDDPQSPHKVIYEPLNLPPGAETVYRVFCRAVKPGFARFSVRLTADQLPAGPVTEEEGTNVLEARNGK